MSESSAYRIFYHVLGNNLIAGVTNNFVWFALTFWAILETNSVVVASFIAGIFAVTNMVGAIFIGGYVDHHRKKTAMLVSSLVSLVAFALGALWFMITPDASMRDPASWHLWTLVLILMIGTVAGNMRMIALSTSVTVLFKDDRDKANGLVGASQGISFSLTSILSGIAIGFFGMGIALYAAVIATAVALIHLLFVHFPETIVHSEENPKKLDIRGTMAIVLSIPGLLALIFFHTFNNLLGGVFMALMDAYGLALVSVQTWGTMWGVMSIAMIAGGIVVSKVGVGKNPLRTIMIINLISWTSCLLFPLQASVFFLAAGMFCWMFFFPIAEAAEQTVIQNVVPPERQGRVFGFAQSIESAATPVTAFLIGPIAQWIFIPFMTTGAGVALLGDWFGTGADRGIALVFITAGLVGLVVTTLAFNSKSYHLLSRHYTSTVKDKTTETT